MNKYTGGRPSNISLCVRAPHAQNKLQTNKLMKVKKFSKRNTAGFKKECGSAREFKSKIIY